ncbi:CoA-transferase family III [Auriculariales sp. MPI-PUGE-AT-0066]|nr:CoA-transferase family III [Auriculariales sp. MPI-PUGE-AT-0066]
MTTNSLKAARNLWLQAALPESALSLLQLPGRDPFPSSFNLGDAAQASIGCCALTASLILSHRTSIGSTPARVSVSAEDAAAEFRSEQLATLGGKVGEAWDVLAGQYRARDGWVRPHTNWQHHKYGVLDLLGLQKDASRDQVATAFRTQGANEFAEKAMEQGLVCTALRSFDEWDATAQGQAALARQHNGPVKIIQLLQRHPKPFSSLSSRKPLEGIRVLDLTRVIAGPVAGRTLAAYGADSHLHRFPPFPGSTLTPPAANVPSKWTFAPPLLDRATFANLVRDADVVLQAYRPAGLASLGFSVDDLLQLNPDLIYASLSAWGDNDASGGPWRMRKGFDSLVQFASGFGYAEGEAWAQSQDTAQEVEVVPKALPCQALDHGSGYLLAFGIQAALYRRATVGGAYIVTNSLLDTATWVRSLGRRLDPMPFAGHLESLGELRQRGHSATLLGRDGAQVEYVRHAAMFSDGVDVGWTHAPASLGADTAKWNQR